MGTLGSISNRGENSGALYIFAANPLFTSFIISYIKTVVTGSKVMFILRLFSWELTVYVHCYTFLQKTVNILAIQIMLGINN